MKSKTSRTLAVGMVLAAILAGRAWAILGIGDIVFDPSNFEQAVRQVLEMERQYRQLVDTYQMVRNQYEHMVRMAQRVPVNMRSRYRAQPTPWRGSAATNIYGTTAGWISGVNTGRDVAAGYSQATQPLVTYGDALSNIPGDQVPRIRTTYATVELTDGANRHGIETIGRLRANAPAVETAIQGLEDDSLSSDPAMNTEVAVLNKINAAHLITIRNTQDTNKLLVAVAEAQLVDAKRTRDAEAQAINNHTRFMRDGKVAMAAQASGASAAMRVWRMP